MTFLNPIVLLGLVAAGIPLIIHLFNFRRPQRIDFSSLAFVRELEKTTMRRVRIKQWLLLLMRTLAIASLVLAFARPTFTGQLARAVGGDARAAVGILVDNSRSMDVRDASGSVIEQALETARVIVEQSGNDDEFVVMTTAGPSSRQPVEFHSADGAIDYLQDLTVSDGVTALTEAAGRLGSVLGESPLFNKELFIIGDAQRSTFGDSTRALLPDELLVRLIKLNERAVGNVAITDVAVESRIVEPGRPVRVSARVTNYGERAVENYVSSVFLDGQRVAQSTVSIPSGGTVEAQFTATAAEAGWVAGTIVGEPDDFSTDDERHFTLHVPQERRLLIVRGDDANVEYLQLALSSDPARERAVFHTTTIGEAQLPNQLLETFHAVALVGVSSFSSGEVAMLSKYVEQGGGLLIFPGATVDLSDYDVLLSALGGGRVTGMIGAAESETRAATIARIEFEHPIFEGVFDQETLERGQGVEQFGVSFGIEYEPSAGTEQTLIALSSGGPFMQEMRHGGGGALLFAVAPDPGWSDFPVRGLFVPLLYRSVFYVSAGEQAGGEQLVVGRPGEIRLSGVARDADVRLRSPGGDEILPEIRNLFGALLLQTNEQIVEAGVYDVLRDDQIVRRVAYNLGQDESDLGTYDANEATARLSTALDRNVTLISGREARSADIERTIQAARTGAELWNVLLLLALLFLAAEMVIEKRWRPEAAV